MMLCATCLDFSEDKVKPRVRWPRFYKLMINGHEVHESEERTSQVRHLDVAALIKHGRNTLVFECGIRDFHLVEGPYLPLLRIVQARTVPEVTAFILGARTISLEQCKQRAMQSFSTDDDDGLVATESRVSLRCPLGLAIITSPARGRECMHLQCFELQTYISFNHNMRHASKTRWKCPICYKPVSSDEVVVDSFLQEILTSVDREGEIDSVCLREDGSWKLIVPEKKKQNNERGNGGSSSSSSEGSRVRQQRSTETRGRATTDNVVETNSIMNPIGAGHVNHDNNAHSPYEDAVAIHSLTALSDSGHVFEDLGGGMGMGMGSSAWGGSLEDPIEL